MSFEFPLPDVGEGLTEADIVAWKVAAGDTVTVNQILVEIETAKSLVELPSPQAGTIDALLVDEGQTIEVGTPIIRFGGGESGAEAGSAAAGSSETGGSGSDSGGPAEATSTEDADGGATLVGYGARTTSSKRRPRKGAPVPSPSAASAEAAPAPAESGSAAPSASTAATSPSPAASAAQPGAAGAGEPATVSGGAAKPLAKPPVRKLAKDLGVDLSQVVATGPHGDVTRDDVRGAADQVSAPTSDATATTAASASDRGEAEERIPFKGVTKMMAKAMVD